MAPGYTLSHRPGTTRTVSIGTPSRQISYGGTATHVPRFSLRSTSLRYDPPGHLYQVDDSSVVIAIGSRHLEVGLAGDADPRALLRFSPQLSARLDGRFSRSGPLPPDTARNSELYDLRCRDLDLGLVYDKLERCLRKIHIEHLMLDVKGQKAVLAVSPLIPYPILQTILRAVFESAQQPPSISVMSNDLASLIAAGLRSALVIDIGWHETTVSAMYEFRAVARRSTSCAVKALHAQIGAALAESTDGGPSIPFGVIEDVLVRLAYCAPTASEPTTTTNNRSCTIPVSESASASLSSDSIPEIVSRVFLGTDSPGVFHDDDAIPLPELAWRLLSSLSHDVRGVCVSRIIITGGGSRIPGLSTRVRSELASLIAVRGYDTTSYGSATRAAAKVRSAIQRTNATRSRLEPGPAVHDDEIHARILHAKIRLVEDERKAVSSGIPSGDDAGRVPPLVRGVESLGSFAGSSMAAHLRLKGAVEIKRDEFARWGLGGKEYAF